MYTALLKRRSFIALTLSLLFFAVSCVLNSQNPEQAIVGTWRFVGIGDSNIGGTPMPATSEDVARFNEELTQLTVQYQFKEDGTVLFLATGPATDSRSGVTTKPESVNMNETGTYQISSDGRILAINMPANLLSLLGLVSMETSLTEFVMSIEDDKLTLRYSIEQDSPGSFINFVFERF